LKTINDINVNNAMTKAIQTSQKMRNRMKTNQAKVRMRQTTKGLNKRVEVSLKRRVEVATDQVSSHFQKE
jgi:hypothetical protein